jgi:hypothetical protein
MISGESVMTRWSIRALWQVGVGRLARSAPALNLRRAASRRQRGYPPDRVVNVNGRSLHGAWSAIA